MLDTIMTEDSPVVVIFRADNGGDNITAVFPEIPGTVGRDDMTCYAHVGQHSACTRAWYYTTRPARPDEYRDLAAELAGLGYKLTVRQRITQTMNANRRAEIRRQDSAVSSRASAHGN